MYSYRSLSKEFRRAGASSTLAFAALILGSATPVTPVASAQTLVSGDVAGTISDASGAAIPNAKVHLKNLATGEEKDVTSGSAGTYRVPLLKPGQYSIIVSVSGFQTTSTQINISAGQTADGSVKLNVGGGAETVEVTEAAPLLHTEDAAISTVFDFQAVQQIPNPGNDVTFVAQTAPGSVMNTQGGYGNFSSFGLPATSNTFTTNGSYENDPYLNLNNSGASNLLLGNNDVSSVSVTSPAYDASFGGLGGAQVNEITRSGANTFHGNATYWWNGRIMNANNWFNKHAAAGQQTPRQFVNANQWAAAIGGPIRRDKTFFFINTEGLRVIIPSRATVYAPSPAYQASTLATVQATYPSEVPYYQRIFNVYNNASGATNAVADSNDPNVVIYNGTATTFASEWLMTGRIDQNISENDRLFGHFKMDKGTQPTFSSVLNPLFNVLSPQPSYEGQLSETHSFSPNITNQFVFAAAYYRAIFTNTQQTQANALVPVSLVFLTGDLANNTFASLPGGENFDFPQGRNVTGYQFIDDLSMTRGAHTVKVGWAIRRDDITDYGPSVRAITPEAYASETSFGAGLLTRFRQNFPQRPSQPVSVYGMGAYIQDTWKAAPNLSVTLGMRFEHNSNPVSHTNSFANLRSDFSTLAAATTGDTPYNQLINSGRHRAYPAQQPVAYEPRIGFSYQPFGAGSKTTVRGGFGIFADSLPGQIAGDLLNNAPTNVQFYLRGSYTLDPALANSGQQAVTASNQAFRSSYAGNASYNSLAAAGIGFVAPAFTSTVHRVGIPTYETYTLGFEQQLDAHTVVAVSYVGNHGYHEPVQNGGVNAYAFGSLPAAAPQPSFAAVTEVETAASSNYNGGLVTVRRQQKNLQLQFNYIYSHALDEISNGGFNQFGLASTIDSIYPEDPHNLSANYGNADYDIRHYISANYVIDIPRHFGPGWLTGNWQVAGTVFHSTGLPFTVVDSNIPLNYVGDLFAQQLANKGFSHTCAGSSAVDHPCALGTSGGSSLGYAYFDGATNFAQQRRNQFRGSSFTDTDMDLMKSFHVPHLESGNLRLGAQFFNLFNHPNFGQPLNDVNGQIGVITQTANVPTSIFGAFFGGDASPRLIQLKASFTF
jgi:hypothetical protein